MTSYSDLLVQIMDDFRKHYSYLSFKQHSVDDIIRFCQKNLSKVNDSSDLIITILKALSVWNDPHIAFLSPQGAHIKCPLKALKNNFNFPYTYKSHFTKNSIMETRAGAIGRVHDVIYLNLENFSQNMSQSHSMMLRLLAEQIVSHKKIIIDLRSNSGGSQRIAQDYLSHFIPSGSIRSARYLYRLSEDDPTKLGNEQFSQVSAHPSLRFKGKIAVLIGNWTMGSAENFALGLRELRKKGVDVGLFGEKTRGSSGNPIPYKTNGLEYLISSWVCYTVDGELLEGNGISPDVTIKKHFSFAKDNAVAKALKYLKPNPWA